MESFNSINEYFQHTVKQFPDKTALVFQEKKFTFLELQQYVEKLAKAFYSEGIKKGDRVIIYLPHMHQWIISWLAMQQIGVIAVPVSHFYKHDNLYNIAKNSGAETIVCSDNNFNETLDVSGQLFKKTIVVGTQDTKKLEEQAGGIATEILPFDDLLNKGDIELPLNNPNGKEIAEILYTSGTTGEPKGVPIKNKALLESLYNSKNAYKSLIPKGEGIAIQGAPINHILGQEIGLGALLAGDTLILLPSLKLEELFASIQQNKVTTFFGTPTLCRMILEHEQLDDYDLSSLKYVFTGGEALPLEIAKKWHRKFGNPLFNGYGSTETCGGVFGATVEDEFPVGTIGKCISHKKVKLINTEDDGAGELLVSSEYMTTGYWNNPDESEKRFVEVDGQLWYKTGDVVYQDKDGWYFFKERSVYLIKHKGYRVVPTKIERVLYEHEAVSSSCVIGVYDQTVGEKIKAFVVLKDGMTATDEDLINWCNEKLVSYEVPHFIEFRSDLPKSAVGKILRKKLREEEMQGA